MISLIDFSLQTATPSYEKEKEEAEREREREDEGEGEGEGEQLEDNFLILASDGVWDTVCDNDSAKYVRKYPKDALRSAVLIRDSAYLKGSRGSLSLTFISLSQY